MISRQRRSLLQRSAFSLWVVISLLLAFLVGCSSSSYNARLFHPWSREDARDFKELEDGYKQVLVGSGPPRRGRDSAKCRVQSGAGLIGLVAS